jgi:hypothetical protein
MQLPYSFLLLRFAFVCMTYYRIHLAVQTELIQGTVYDHVERMFDRDASRKSLTPSATRREYTDVATEASSYSENTRGHLRCAVILSSVG